MANIKSQIKRNRQNERRRVRNKGVKSELRTRLKRALAAADEGSADAAEMYRQAQQRIDSAASKGIIPKRTAARRKSRLARHIAG